MNSLGGDRPRISRGKREKCDIEVDWEGRLAFPKMLGQLSQGPKATAVLQKASPSRHAKWIKIFGLVEEVSKRLYGQCLNFANSIAKLFSTRISVADCSRMPEAQPKKVHFKVIEGEAWQKAFVYQICRWATAILAQDVRARKKSANSEKAPRNQSKKVAVPSKK